MKKEIKKEEKPVYIMCPRCELNYIPKKEKHCKVCKAEMGLIDAAILIPDEEEIGVEKLCPFCSVNFIGEDETICFECQKEREKKVPSDDEDWDDFEPIVEEDDIEPVENLGLIVPEEVFGDEKDGDEDEDEDIFSDQYKEPDDFDYDVDESDFLDREEEDDEEEEEDDDFPV